jgi:hypothetical protein
MGQRFASAEIEALLYDGSFPLNFLRQGEMVGAVPGRGLDGSCRIDTTDGEPVFVAKGELLIRDSVGELKVLAPVDYDEGGSE